MANQFGIKIEVLRKANNLLKRLVNFQLEIDTPMLCKIEQWARKAKNEQIVLFADHYKANKDALLTLWLADHIFDDIKDEDMAFKAMDVAQESLMSKKSHQKTIAV